MREKIVKFFYSFLLKCPRSASTAVWILLIDCCALSFSISGRVAKISILLSLSIGDKLKIGVFIIIIIKHTINWTFLKLKSSTYVVKPAFAISWTNVEINSGVNSWILLKLWTCIWLIESFNAALRSSKIFCSGLR